MDRLKSIRAGVAEVVFNSRSEPDIRGDVSCVAQLLTHPAPIAPAPHGIVSVTVQAVLKADAQALPGLPDPAAAHRVEEPVPPALAARPGVRTVTTRLVATVGVSAPGA
ncbi:hypothetical protein ACFWVC_29645 [Streptomyces sp. NPDC058691]|uniref:hypothetical protein n=1 Tax=Streptomyces sp. NPDC058691 TaxID=3346601 RepID=UPI00364974D8